MVATDAVSEGSRGVPVDRTARSVPDPRLGMRRSFAEPDADERARVDDDRLSSR